MAEEQVLTGIAGVDEAGRGPMIGPMIVCGVLVDPSDLSVLQEMGVKDSKVLSPKRRSELSRGIQKLAKRVAVRRVTASRIDLLRNRGTTLNEIEVREFALVLRTLRPEIAYLDAADVNPDRFRDLVVKRMQLQPERLRVVSEHKADSKYVVVSAASVVAKVERDAAIEVLHSRYGDFGSGYPSDPKTVEFVRGVVNRDEDLPDFVRATWAPVIAMMEHRPRRRTSESP